MIEQSENPLSQDIEITDLTAALINALGIKTSEEGEKIQSATIFLSKLHRKYSQYQGKKYHQVKLSRLNGLFYKVCKEPPTEKSDIVLVTQIMLSFLNNEGSNPINDSNSSIETDSFASSTCFWIAKIIEEILSVKSPELCQQMLDYLLKNKKKNSTNPDQFDKDISESLYFKDKEITREDEEKANKKTNFKGFMTEHSCFEEIKNNFNVENLFSNLYLSHASKSLVLNLFATYCKQVDIQNVKQLFVKIFVEGKVQTKETISYILECLDSQIFTGQDFTEVVKLMVNSNDRKLFHCLALKGLKNQSKYIQILSQNIKPNFADELADIFVNSEHINNYYLLYLIQKSNQRLSQKYLTLPSGKAVTNRVAIICSIAISHNIQKAHNKILQYFFENENGMSNKQKLDYLRIAHFSYLQISKSHLFTSILKSVPAAILDQQSNFQFLPKDHCQKINLQKVQRQQLSDFLSRYFGNNPDVSSIKLDLYSLCGKQLSFMQDFKRVQKIFEAPLDQILQDLHSVPENLLEVVLMGINNKLVDQYLVNQIGANSTLQWALDCYKKEYKKFKHSTDAFLKRTHNSNLLEVSLQLFDFNLDQNTEHQFSQEFSIITNPQSARRLKGFNFSQYFMASEGEQNEPETLLRRNKNCVIELQKLIKMLSNESKSNNRKELKTLISEESTPLRALKIIKSLSLVPYEKFKNAEKTQKLTESLLSYIKPQFENLKQLSQRASNVNIPYIPLFESLQFLLAMSYETTIDFLAQLLKSKQGKGEEKGKKNKKKAEQGNEKIQNFTQKLQFCFRGDPSLLKNYDSIISIIEQIEQSSRSQSISAQLAKWMGRIKIFHVEDYGLWKQKVLNYVKLWETISNIVLKSISTKEVQRHFLIMIDLLNTLYEKYREEKDRSFVEKKLFNGLYILYFLAKAQNVEIDEQIQQQIPTEKLNQYLINYQINQVSDSHVYYCFDCSKKACNQCSMIVHRNHDKNYIGQGSQIQCHRHVKNRQGRDHKESRQVREVREARQARDAARQGRQWERPKISKEKYMHKIKQGNIEAYERQRLLYFHHNSQNWTAQQLLKYQEEKAASLKKFLGQSESMQLDQEEDKKKSQDDEDDIMEIKSCSEKQFNIKNTAFVAQDKKPSLCLGSEDNIRKKKSVGLNLTPLFNLLIRELRSNSFISAHDLEQQQKNSASQFEAEISNEKYTIFKMEAKGQNYRMNSNYLTNPDSQVHSGLAKRGMITINDKFLALVSATYNTNFLDTHKIKSRFSKKEAEKRYRQNDTIDSYLISQTKVGQSPIIQVSLSPYTTNCLAEVSATKIIFQHISKETRNRVIAYQQGAAEITKFEWVKSHSLRNYYSYLSNGSLNISKLGKVGAQVRQRISLGNKKIRDYSTSAFCTKVAMITILDVEGKIYRAKFDSSSKTEMNFRSNEIEYNSGEQIVSVYNQGVSIYCTTMSGKIIVMNLNEQNNFSSPPSTFPIIEYLKSHKISEINNKFREVSKITKLRYITKHQNQIFLSCILTKQSPIQQKKTGYFIIVSLNTQNKKSRIVLFNDQGNTECYDFVTVTEKQFLFICLQEDGELWSTKFTSPTKSTLAKLAQLNLITSLTLNDISIYSEQVARLNLWNRIQFYNKDRKKSVFRQNIKITDHFKTNITDNYINFDPLEKFTRAEFPTGIQIGYIHNPEVDGPKSQLVFTFLGNSYRFQIQRTRQIQIPLTIKETLGIYMGIYPFKIQFIKGKPSSNIKNITLFGVKYSDRSPYLEALTYLFELLLVYRPPKEMHSDKTLENYLFNDLKTQLNAINPKTLDEYFTRKKMRLHEQNLLFKLELLRESIPVQIEDSSLLYQCFQSIRNNVLSFCYQRKQLNVSVHKLCEVLSISNKDSAALKIGHFLNAQTQLDIYNVFKFHQIFKTEATVDSYYDLLQILNRILDSRALDGFIILSVYPQMLCQMCKFFKKILSEYRLYFRMNDNGLQKEEKQKINKMCNSLIRLLIENYQLSKNRVRKEQFNSEEEILIMLEGIFCLNNKQVHKQIKLNPFQYFQPIFKQGLYHCKHGAINFLNLQEVELQIPKSPSQQIGAEEQQKVSQMNAINASQMNINKERSDIEIQIEQQQSREQHKEQDEQNRQMIEDFGYDIQGEGNLKIGEDDDEDLGSEVLINQFISSQQQLNVKLDTEKVYSYLREKCSEMVPQSISFAYQRVCENILLEIFRPSQDPTMHKYLNGQNVVFYIGLVYNMMQIIEKNLQNISQFQKEFDFQHPYVIETLFPIFKLFDERIDSKPHSILYLPLNSIFTANIKAQPTKSLLIRCLAYYYSKNIKDSKFLIYMTQKNWYAQEMKNSVSLTSVLRFEFFHSVNPAYQLKYIGNLYTHFCKLEINPFLVQQQEKIKEMVLKSVVKYNLRVFHNIMVSKKWNTDLERTRIKVAFEKITTNPQQSLKVMTKSIGQNVKIFVEDTNKYPERILALESLLGENSKQDEMVLEILNSYYSYWSPN